MSWSLGGWGSICVLVGLFLVGVGDVCGGGESSKRRDAVWSGEEVGEGVMDESVRGCVARSVATVRMGVI
jgi:hypothetical protein